MGGAVNPDAVNAALVAQAAQGPNTAPAAPTPTTQPGVQPFAANTYFGGVNPFRQSAQAPAQSSFSPQPPAPARAQSSTLRLPGFQGVANPFYSAPNTSQTAAMQPMQPTQSSQAQSLSSQYDLYHKANADRLAAADAQRQANALEAQKAYQTARGNEALRAEYEQKMADLQSQIQQQQAYSDSNYGSWGYANGGIASLQQGFKR